MRSKKFFRSAGLCEFMDAIDCMLDLFASLSTCLLPCGPADMSTSHTDAAQWLCVCLGSFLRLRRTAAISSPDYGLEVVLMLDVKT